jgi:competence protein ComFC
MIREDFLALGFYSGSLEKAVRAFKFHGTTRLANLFASELARAVKKSGWKVDGVCPVPLHWTRRLERGYNQSALIARPLANELSFSYTPLLQRVKRTKQQATLGRLERVSNVEDAFIGKKCQGNVLLIDDVVTSGATTRACVEALLKAGASKVKIAAIAKAK